jgi:hypothetical protein
MALFAEEDDRVRPGVDVAWRFARPGLPVSIFSPIGGRWDRGRGPTVSEVLEEKWLKGFGLEEIDGALVWAREG